MSDEDPEVTKPGHDSPGAPSAAPHTWAPPATTAGRNQTSATGKSRAIAAALALLLGILGIHRLYLGRGRRWIVVYLLLIPTTFMLLIAWIEGILILGTSNEDWAVKYGGPVKKPNRVAIALLWVYALWPPATMMMFVVWLSVQ